MLAYYGSGRYADALRVHQQARQLLMAEFGSRTGAELNRIHRGVLDRLPADDLVRGPAVTTRTAKRPPSAPLAPRNLPRQPPLVGRRSELGALTSAVGAESADGAVLTLETVSGMAGVGKTAVAVHTARKLAPRFPDGQVFLDLRAHSHAQEPLSPDAALATLLRMFGTPAETIPVGLNELTTLWRTMLAERRAVIVLDDAVSPDQVRPLLPGGSPSLTIITSRRHLTGLPHARPIPVDVLPQWPTRSPSSGVSRARSGPRTSRRPPASSSSAATCLWRSNWWGTGSARAPPGPSPPSASAWPAVRAASARSATPTRRWCVPSTCPIGRSPKHSAPRSAAWACTPDPTSRPRPPPPCSVCHRRRPNGCWRTCWRVICSANRRRTGTAITTLLGEYARMLALSEDTGEERGQALERMTIFYLQAAETADRLAYPGRVRLDGHPADPGLPLPRLRNADETRAWFNTEHGNLLAAERYARTHGFPHLSARIAHSLAGFLDAECRWQDAVDVLQHAAAHWSSSGDRPALCVALLCLSSTHASTGRYPQAAETGERALEIARATGDREAEAEALRVLGVLHWHLGENRTAVELHQKALAIRMTAGSIWDQAKCHNNIAISLLSLGEQDRALEYFRQAISGFRTAGDQSGLARALNNLGDLYAHKGDLTRARRAFEESLPLAESTGNLYAQATVRTNLAAILAESGDPGAALALHQQALREFQVLGDRKSQATAHNGLGEAHHKAGSADEAERHHRKALDIARGIGTTQEVTRALRGLGRTELGRGQLDSAAEHLEAAIAAAHRVNDPDEEARARDTLAEVRLATGDVRGAKELLRQALAMMCILDEQEAIRINNRLIEIDQTSTG